MTVIARLLSEFPLLTPEDAEEWIVSIPLDMPTLLHAMNDNKLVEVARQCEKLPKRSLVGRQMTSRACFVTCATFAACIRDQQANVPLEFVVMA